jgi:para-aminobenzoate synthetase/4-amino-4-deoxychorismate lyase
MVLERHALVCDREPCGLVVLRDATTGQWLRFSRPSEVIETDALAEVVSCLRRVESLVNDRGLHAVGFLSYEAAPAFDRALPVRPAQGFPLLWFGLYRRPEIIDMETPNRQTMREAANWTPSIPQADYEAAVTDLRECIANGETYQVNYTFRFRKPSTGDAWPLFLELVEAQQGPYSAYLETPRLAVCSASPELFFRLSGREIVSRPMKGTVRRGRSYAEDQERARWLHRSEKNRAENAMIVDMMRNDLGKIARVGSVAVRDVFEVERYPTVWQMTSTVTAETAASVVEILAALFPCASVTGAPKPNTMRIIARAETSPRGIYTGTIGWIAPGRQAQFNVAIRTVVVDKSKGEAEYGAGGGVVWDSTPAGEYEECWTKAKILTERRPAFSLLETMLWSGEGFQPASHGPSVQPANPLAGYFLLDEHLGRLVESAEYFGFPLDMDQLRQELADLAQPLPLVAHKVRLLVSRSGEIFLSAQPVAAEDLAEPVRLEWASRPVDSADPFLYHKTTHRQVYEAARQGCTRGDDVLVYNERGEVTESCIANLVVRLEGEWFTPPVECGLLPGTFRARLLAEGKVRERVVTREMLVGCDQLFLVNSVRKWRRAELLGDV